jgi:hypothetical protein
MNPQSLRQEVESLVKAEWTKIRAKLPRAGSPQEFTSWEYQLTPPIPAAWPPDGQGVVYYYAFAYGTRMDLRDAQLVAVPWARITVDGESTPRLEILEKEIKQVGIQGVRPLRKEEIEIFAQRAAVEEQIRKLATKTFLAGIDPQPLREFFQFWCSTHGVVAEQLRPRHPQFFAWVGCKQ